MTSKLAGRVVNAVADLGTALRPHLGHLDAEEAEQMFADFDTLTRMVEQGSGLAAVANLVARMARRLRIAAGHDYATAEVARLRSIERAAVRLRDGWASYVARRQR
jgi:galactose-1-phosphate uridylyltransferase